MVVISKADFESIMSQLSNLISLQKAHNELLEKYAIVVEENKSLKQQVGNLTVQLDDLKRAVYGSKSERYIGTTDAKQINLFDVPAQTPPEQKEETITYSRKVMDKEKPTQVRNPFPDHLPRVDNVIWPEGVDPDTAVVMRDQITEQLDYTPGQLRVIRHIRKVVKVKTVNEYDEEITKFLTGNLPTFPIARGIASAALIAHILVSKYCFHLPYYRQVEMFKRLGVIIATSTIDGWQTDLEKLFEPLYKKFIEYIFSKSYLMADESKFKVITKDKANKKGRKIHTGWMWFYHDPLEMVTLVNYQKSRNKDGPVEMLKNFSGSLHTDAYQVYDIFEKRDDMKLLNCMVHARREFEGALKNDPEKANYALNIYKALFAIESDAKENFSGLADEEYFEKRKSYRIEHALPVLNEFKKWLDENYRSMAPKSQIGQAFAYCMKRWDKLTKYLENGKYEISTNLIENAIRGLAIGRNNYMFGASLTGANFSAMMYSFFITCKQLGIDEWKWCTEVLSKLPDAKPSDIDQLLPWNWKKNKEQQPAC